MSLDDNLSKPAHVYSKKLYGKYEMRFNQRTQLLACFFNYHNISLYNTFIHILTVSRGKTRSRLLLHSYAQNKCNLSIQFLLGMMETFPAQTTD